MKSKSVEIIDVNDFDDLVEETYGRPYSFQQQDGCKDRGIEYFTVPNNNPIDYENDSIPELVNGDKMGVSFKSWLERNPKQLLTNNTSTSSLDLFWYRNFYPDLEILTNDLYNRGLIKAGTYGIDIDW